MSPRWYLGNEACQCGHWGLKDILRCQAMLSQTLNGIESDGILQRDAKICWDMQSIGSADLPRFAQIKIPSIRKAAPNMALLQAFPCHVRQEKHPDLGPRWQNQGHKRLVARVLNVHSAEYSIMQCVQHHIASYSCKDVHTVSWVLAQRFTSFYFQPQLGCESRGYPWGPQEHFYPFSAPQNLRSVHFCSRSTWQNHAVNHRGVLWEIIGLLSVLERAVLSQKLLE